jgi:hypothetical protein
MKIALGLIAMVFVSASCISSTKNNNVEFKQDKDNRKVEVYIEGKHFTSFIYPNDMEKPVLFPILTASGKAITRGYPIEPRAFERTDHPHHVGLWFNFGDVNGLDFWNNSFAIKPENKHKYGTIHFKEIVNQDQNASRLVTKSEWVDNENSTLIEEETSFIFSGDSTLRSIERITNLKAVQEITFKENKEGLFGLRVDRAFEEPSKEAGEFLDANGIVTSTPVLNNEGVNGIYRNAEGITGGAAWGKRSAWVALRTEKEGEIITIVMIDHPENQNYPAWWHARGYGLFAVNNLGGRAFDEKADPVLLELDPGENLIFKHKLVIGGDLTDEEITAIAEDFASDENH